jgi:hypothetical protein
MQPYALQDGEGRSYLWYNFLFTMKAGPRETGGAFALMDFATRKGEEPPSTSTRAKTSSSTSSMAS